MSPTVQRKLCERLAAETQEREPSPAYYAASDGRLRRLEDGRIDLVARERETA